MAACTANVIVQLWLAAIIPPVQLIALPPEGALIVPIVPVPVQETVGVIDASTSNPEGRFSRKEFALIPMAEALE